MAAMAAGEVDLRLVKAGKGLLGLASRDRIA
jgi:hypothetical protein